MTRFDLPQARHPGHDAGGGEAKQGAHHTAALVRGVALLEGQHPMEGSVSSSGCVFNPHSGIFFITINCSCQER